MKVRVSKNLKGRIVIPAISAKSIGANTIFEISESAFWDQNVQRAILKKLLVVDESVPKKTTEVKQIINKSTQSVALPGIGILKPHRKAIVKITELESEAFKRLIDLGVLSVEGNASVAKPPRRIVKEKKEKSPTDDWQAVIIDPTEDGEARTRRISPLKKQQQPKNKKGVVTNDDGSIIIDPRVKDSSEDDSDSIIFVDHEQQKLKIAEHPILGKKGKGKGKK